MLANDPLHPLARQPDRGGSARAAVEVRAIAEDEARGWAAFLAVERARTYAHRMPGSFGDELGDRIDDVAEEVRHGIVAGDAYAAAFVGDRIVGVVNVVAGPEAWEVRLGHVPAPADRTLGSLYVHPDWQGSGLADRLLAAALDDRAVYLWIIDGNDRARRFYERRGWRDVPGSEAEGWHGVGMRRMLRAGEARSLDAAARDERDEPRRRDR